MLDVRGRRTTVVGGGAVAARKVKEFLAAGALVAVIAPEPSAVIEDLAAQKALTLERRAYRQGDLAGAILAVVATDDTRVQELAWIEARARGIFVNTVDEISRCSFITPSILRRGPLTIAVSTDGTNPGLARRIRERLEAHFPKRFGRFLELAAFARKKLREKGVDYAARDRFAGDVFNSAAAHAVETGDEYRAESIVTDIAAKYTIDAQSQTLRSEGAT